MKNNKGFTLVETLVVIVLFVIVGGISVNLLFSAMKSSTKSAMMNQIKQNGDYALAVMERTIRNGKTVTSVCDPTGTNLQTLDIQNIDESTTSFTIDPGVPEADQQIKKDSVPITSTELKFVATENNYFVCTQAAGKPASIAIYFTLTSKNWSSNDPAPTMSFQTSITLRNY